MFHLVECLLARLNRFLCRLSEVGVLVHDVVEISNFPLQRGFVIGRGDLNQVRPSQVSFKTNNILHGVAVGASEKYLRMVLVLNVHFHGGLNKGSHGHQVGLVVFF